jgi:hypothetical protein
VTVHLETVGSEAVQQELTVDIVVGPCKVCDEEPGRVVGVMQILGQAEVVQNVLGNVPPLNESRLEVADDVVQGEMESVGHGFGKELHVCVKEGDGAEAHQQICRTARLVHRADQALQQGLQRRWLWGGEGIIEHLHEERADLLPQGHIELVGQAIQPRSLPTLAAHESTMQLLLHHNGSTGDRAAQRALRSRGLARGQSLVKAPQDGSTGLRGKARLVSEDASGTVPGEVVDGHGEGALGAPQGGQVSGIFWWGVARRPESGELRRLGL